MYATALVFPLSTFSGKMQWVGKFGGAFCLAGHPWRWGVGMGRGDEMYEHGAARLCERINQGRCWQIYRRDKVSRNRCFLHTPREIQMPPSLGKYDFKLGRSPILHQETLSTPPLQSILGQNDFQQYLLHSLSVSSINVKIYRNQSKVGLRTSLNLSTNNRVCRLTHKKMTGNLYISLGSRRQMLVNCQGFGFGGPGDDNLIKQTY